MKKEKKPRNEQNQRHGYWGINFINGNSSYKMNYVNGDKRGYYESYNYDNYIIEKVFFL